MSALLRRPERDGDAALLFELFREVRGGVLTGLDTASRDALLRRQSVGQAWSYRTQHPGARFEVVGDGAIAAGRPVTDPTASFLAVLDLCLLAEHRGRGRSAAALVCAARQRRRAASLPAPRLRAGAKQRHPPRHGIDGSTSALPQHPPLDAAAALDTARRAAA